LNERYEEISKKNDKLQELEKLRDSLLHMIVHDLKNPLFAISGNIEMLLLDKHRFSETQITAVANCLAGCKELNKMIQQLLDIHKLENGKLKLNKKITDLTPLLDGVVKQLVKKAEAKQISITFSNTNSISSVTVDNGLIKRVVANLLDNGIRHTPTGGKVEVAAESVNGQNSLCVSIKDSGNGLEPAYHQKVFNKFEQVELNKKGVSVGTAGLGLAFCRLAVEAHGGKIWVESEGEGKGSSFLFTIPIN
jgi:signal transduction histidine kinase